MTWFRQFLFLIFSLILTPATFAHAFKADFAIYNTSLDQTEDGVWKSEVAALQNMLHMYGWTYEILDFNQINQGQLGKNQSLNYRGIIMPGGYSALRLKHLYPQGMNNIEAFVKSGGGYIGFCAGAYYSGQNVHWSENSSDQLARSNYFKDYIEFYNYGSPNLFPGEIRGPFGWIPWRTQWDRNLPTGFSSVRFNLKIPTLRKISMPTRSSLFYFGGPYFRLTSENLIPKNYEVWAWAIKPDREKELSPSSSQESAGEGMPTIIRFSLEKGQVILFSYHPIILVDPFIDGIQVHEQIRKNVQFARPEDGSVNENNYNSWNILHAAFSLISGREVLPMQRPGKMKIAETKSF